MANKSSDPRVTKSSNQQTISGMGGQHDLNAAVCKGLKTQSWKELYQAAICESDLNKLPGCIDDAEAALVICARELFYAVGDDAEAGESLDDAMCILRALRRSLEHRPSAIQSTSNLKADAA